MILNHGNLTEQELIDALSQLKSIRAEIGILEQKVRHLEQIVEHRKNVSRKMMDEGESWETITKFINPVFEVYQSTMRHTSTCLEEYSQLMQFIYATPDSLMRRILIERYVNGHTWLRVAFMIGGHDEQHPRRLHNQFIAEYVRKHNNIQRF